MIRPTSPGQGRLRLLLLAVMSWLGLAPAVEAQQDRPLDRGAIEAVLARLDAAFAAGHIEDYLARFAPDHPGAHALYDQRLRRLLGCGVALQRRSAIVGEPRRVGPRTVVRVRAELTAAGSATALEPEDTIYAFRADGDRAVPTFAVDTPRSTDCPARDSYCCPACNFAVGGEPGWICVPMARERSQALDAVSFYLAGTDLACDITVRVATAPPEQSPTPIALVEQLARALADLEPGAHAGLAVDWLPPAHRDAVAAGLGGARIELALPPTAAATGGGLAQFHVVMLGPLQLLLLVRGSKAAMVAHRAQLDALLQTFHLLDLDVDRATLAARPLLHHTGGTLTGAEYCNGPHCVRMTGPAGWRAQQHCGGAAFCVHWTSPAQSSLWLHAYDVPDGMPRWCERTADRWLRALCERAQLALPDDLPEWSRTATGLRTRTVCCPVDDAIPGLGERHLRIAFRDDLLVVADGTGATPADREAIERAFASLQL